MTQRNPVIDVCKGIGILLVVVGHLGTIWGKSHIHVSHVVILHPLWCVSAISIWTGKWISYESGL